MSLLYPGIDDEDAMRWYENIHSMPQSTQAPPTTDLPTDLPLDKDWQNQQFNGGANMWRDSILDPDYRIEYDSGDMRLHESDPYEAYLDGLSGGGYTHDPFPPAQDKPTPPALHPDDPLGDNNMWRNLDANLLPFDGYSDISDLAKNDNPLDRRYSKEGFDMQTAEGYEAYLKSL